MKHDGKSVARAAEIDPMDGQFVKSLIALAVGHGASRIVLGEPCERECHRVPWQPNTDAYPPWDDEYVACLTGLDEQAVRRKRQTSAEEYQESRLMRRLLPMWMKKGNTYQELPPAPAVSLFTLLRTFEAWNGTDAGQPLADVFDSPLPESPIGALSNFVLTLDDSKTVRVSVGFEESYCVSISIH